MSDNDLHLFKVARECSLQSDYCGNAHLGCIVVYKGSVLAKGFNTNKTHTIQDRYNVCRYKSSGNRYLPAKCHAELGALNKVRWLDIDFSKVRVYVYRELKNGALAMARPCSSCLTAIKQMGIRYIYYTSDCGYCYERIVD